MTSKFPAGVLPADVPQAKICPRCQRPLGADKFGPGKKVCLECLHGTQLRQEAAKLQNAVNEATELMSSRSAQNLDAFVSMITEHMGGDGAFAIMIAQQIQHAFEKFPGRASNLTFAFQFMKILGLRDESNLQRDLANLSYEELKVEKRRLAQELFMDLLGPAERRAFALQVLRSTNEFVIDDDLLEAHLNARDDGDEGERSPEEED